MMMGNQPKFLSDALDRYENLARNNDSTHNGTRYALIFFFFSFLQIFCAGAGHSRTSNLCINFNGRKKKRNAQHMKNKNKNL